MEIYNKIINKIQIVMHIQIMCILKAITQMLQTMSTIFTVILITPILREFYINRIFQEISNS